MSEVPLEVAPSLLPSLPSQTKPSTFQPARHTFDPLPRTPHYPPSISHTQPSTISLGWLGFEDPVGLS